MASPTQRHVVSRIDAVWLLVYAKPFIRVGVVIGPFIGACATCPADMLGGIPVEPPHPIMHALVTDIIASPPAAVLHPFRIAMLTCALVMHGAKPASAMRPVAIKCLALLLESSRFSRASFAMPSEPHPMHLAQDGPSPRGTFATRD